MITNGNDIIEYKDYDKVYIPTNKKNSNYTYILSGNNIIIKTNENCTTNYNTTYCDCYQYNIDNNIMGGVYNCSTNNSTQIIPYTSISDDINYSKHIREIYMQDKGIIILMIILGICFAKLLTRERKY